MKKLILGAMSFTILSLMSCGGSANADATTEQIVQQTQAIVHVNVAQFETLLEKENGTILDVRTPEEWAEGIINGAQQMNYYDDDFATQIAALDKSKAVFVYCKAGGRSSSAAEVLKENGFTKIYNLDGGMDAWKEQGKDVQK